MSTQKSKCASCGAVILKNDEALSIAHEEPECAWFKSLIAHGPPPAESREVKSEGVEAHFAALAARRRAKG